MEATAAFFLPSLAISELTVRCPTVLLRAIADRRIEAHPRARWNCSRKNEILYVRLPKNDVHVSIVPIRQKTADLSESTDLKPDRSS